MPGERKGSLRRVRHEKAVRIGVQLQAGVELVEAKALQVMVVRDDVHAVSVDTAAVVREQWKPGAVRSGDIESQFVRLSSANAHAREGNVPVACAAQYPFELGVEIEGRSLGEVRTRTHVNALKAALGLMHHECLAPGQRHEAL